MSFHLNMTDTFCTDDFRVKVSSFQNVIFFYNMKYSTEKLSIYNFACLKILLTAMIDDKQASKVLLH